MAIIGDALRQAFMPKHEYECLREEDKAWIKLQRPVLVSVVSSICLVVVVSTVVSLRIVFPGDSANRPFCGELRLQPLPVDVKGGGGDSDLLPGAFYLTDQEIVDYYWMVVFVPSLILFFASAVYLVAGKLFNFVLLCIYLFIFCLVELKWLFGSELDYSGDEW